MTEDKPMSLPSYPKATGGLVSPSDPLPSQTHVEVPESPVAVPAKAKRGRPAKKTEAQMRAEITASVRAELAAEAQEERQRALKANSLRADGVELAEADPQDAETVTINFVDDGLTLLGTTWCRGEELSVKRGSADWQQTLDARGRSVLEYSEAEQLARWQRRIFSQGHWLGTGYDLNDPTLTPDERAMLVAAEERRAIRSAVPGSRKARTRLAN